MTKCYRHGEIAFSQIDKLPDDLPVISSSKQFLIGSHGNPHSYDNGELYIKSEDQYIFGYFVAKNTKLFHSEHSPDGVVIPDGVYELRRQVEFTPDGLKAVID